MRVKDLANYLINNEGSCIIGCEGKQPCPFWGGSYGKNGCNRYGAFRLAQMFIYSSGFRDNVLNGYGHTIKELDPFNFKKLTSFWDS